MWQPKEIIIHEKVKNDPVALDIFEKCPGVPRRFVPDARAATVKEASAVLRAAGTGMLDQIRAGKTVLFISPAGSQAVDRFRMPDARILCPDFDRLKLASNGCFYQCDWCYLKLTYRAAFPFITVRAEYEKMAKQIERRLAGAGGPVIFNSGELADSLALEHLTGAARWFIPWFGSRGNAWLFMLTKSDQVDAILDLPHNGSTIICWSINNARVSRKFEIGAPPFEARLRAARKVQAAGYPLRLRLDPIVPVEGWQALYAETIEQIFKTVRPERITLGTLRFEEGFCHMQNTLFTTGPELPRLVSEMSPMLPPASGPGGKKPKTGKYSFSEEKRSHLFAFAISEIRKYSNCRIALCKESAAVWEKVGLSPSRCSCACQLDSVDMSAADPESGLH